jgi:hypothetical protein
MFMWIGGCTGGGAAGAAATVGPVGSVIGAAGTGAAVGIGGAGAGDGEGVLATTGATGAGGGAATGSTVGGGTAASATAGRRRTDSRPSKKNTVASKAINAVAAAINTGRVTCIRSAERAARNCQ